MVFVVLAGVCGLALVIAAGISYRRDQDRAVAELLDMVPWSPEVDHEELGAITGRAVELAREAVDRMDRRHRLDSLLDRAKVPLRPGEFVIVVLGGCLGLAALLLVASGSALLAATGALFVVGTAAQVLRQRVTKRRRAFEAQLPDALGLVAASLSAGHTFLRAVQIMCEESKPPLSEEFARLVAETRLGDSLVDTLERMALRLQIRDMDMVVQAIRIQQTVGGRLADLLHTLADFIRARDEVRREVRVLSAEGRMSAYVLAGLVPFLFVVIQVLNPRYLQPLFQGWGLAVLIGCGVSVTCGMVVILRMVRIEV